MQRVCKSSALVGFMVSPQGHDGAWLRWRLFPRAVGGLVWLVEVVVALREPFLVAFAANGYGARFAAYHHRALGVAGADGRQRSDILLLLHIRCFNFMFSVVQFVGAVERYYTATLRPFCM